MGNVKRAVKSKCCVPVTERALLVRLNRKLTKEGQERLKAAKGKARETLGDYYLLDLGGNEVKATHVQLEPYARKLGVLEPYEALICK
jgi:hypothetical protein